MADVPSTSSPIQIPAVRSGAAVSEALMSKIGGDINGLLAAVMPVGSFLDSMLTEGQLQRALEQSRRSGAALQRIIVDLGFVTVPSMFMNALPYILTVIILAGFVGRAIPPRAGGEPYVKER